MTLLNQVERITNAVYEWMAAVGLPAHYAEELTDRIMYAMLKEEK